MGGRTGRRTRQPTRRRPTPRPRQRLPPASPPAAVTEARFEAFALQVEPTRGRSADGAVRAIVGEVLGAGWNIATLSAERGEFELSRPSGSTARPWKLRDLPLGEREQAPSLTTAEAWDATYALRAHPEVVYAEPMFRFLSTEQLVPDAGARPAVRGLRAGDRDVPATDTDFEWSLTQIRAQDAWQLFQPLNRLPGAGIVVGHPDTGYTQHPEIFTARLRAADGFDFEDDDADSIDPLVDGFLRSPGHGTSTASVIFSSVGGGGAQPFMSGIAPDATLVPIRTTKSVVLWSMARLVRAVRHAIDKQVHVVSMSLGGPVDSTPLRHAIQDAEQQGIIVLAAAGNQVGFVVYPAAFDEVIAVAACTIERQPWSGSSHGPAVDVTAPGASVWRAKTDDAGGGLQFRVERGSGTSYAVAATAGVAALWLGFHGRDALVQRYGAARVPAVFTQLLEQTCHVPAGWDTGEYGTGIVDAHALLSASLPAFAPAGGMRGISRRAVSADTTGIERLVHLVDAPRTRVERGVADLLGVPENGLPAALRDVGDELAFHLAVDPGLRRRLGDVAAPRSRGRSRSATAPAGDVTALRRAARHGASRRLRQALGGR